MKDRRKILLIVCVVLAILVPLLWPIPHPIFKDPYASVIESREGRLLGARIAADEQWRFPEMDSIPEKFRSSIVLFEDRYFQQHPGINPVSMSRAIHQNIKAGKIVSGGSTITMQVARMSFGNTPRTLIQKVREIWLALRLEIWYSKEEILALYVNHAPFGGNVVGLHSAAWRYYGRSPQELSWAESANLAVLPNAPALIFPGKNDSILLKKRNRVLDLLLEHGHLDSLEYLLAQEEPLPLKPKPLPQSAQHLLSFVQRQGYDQQLVRTTIDYTLQQSVNRLVEEYHKTLTPKEINNAAALVVEIETGRVLAYIGNVEGSDGAENGSEVDIIQSRRSPGSILKPFLYALAIEEGLISPKQMMQDIPTFYRGFAPQNFDKKFKGAVHADHALRSSLNVPFVNLLKTYGYEKFHHKLGRMGISSLDKAPGHYGLSLILGGGEVSLWEIAGIYAGLGRASLDRSVDRAPFFPNQFLYDSPGKQRSTNYSTSVIGASSAWHTLKVMQSLRRPDAETNWERFGSSRPIAWKTGTSHGHKDAWAVGLNSKYVVAVWVGNADGEGRPDLVGVGAAAPLMFEIFGIMEGDAVFPMPGRDMALFTVCAKSGFKAGENCPDLETEYLSKKVAMTQPCPFHQQVTLDETEKFQVNSQCYPIGKAVTRSWFILPPSQSWYYKSYNADYADPPEFMVQCQVSDRESIEMVYPRRFTRVYVPIEIDGNPGRVIFEAAHHNEEASIYWHLDDEFLGVTKGKHQMGLFPKNGEHELTLVDDMGRELSVGFVALNETEGG